MVVRDLRNPYYPQLASVLSRLAAERGWGVVLCDLGRDDADAEARLTDLLRRVDAVVGSVPAGLAGRGSLPVPVVALDTEPVGPDEPAIAIDYGPGIAAALEHLVARGRRRIAMVDADRTPSRRRLLYRAHLRRHGLAWDPRWEVVSEDTHSGGVTAAEVLRERCPEVDAVLVFNDVIAVGVLKGLTRAGVAVPGELAVVGIDGLDIGTLVTPELTTVAIDRTELARHAVELVAAALGSPADPAGGGRRVLVPTLVVRESS
nr:substrate-binding domain-containing protein [Auraticoccus cholistanensis]